MLVGWALNEPYFQELRAGKFTPRISPLWLIDQRNIDLKELETEKILEKIGTTGRGTYYILKGQKRGKRGTKEAKKG
jgi:hypothetical protein